MTSILDIRDVSIINSLPTIVKADNMGILCVGSGGGRIEHWLHNNGYNVLATDIADLRKEEYRDTKFEIMDIYNPPNIQCSVVICSEVLEHLTDVVKACANLSELAIDRIILTIPVGLSFCDESHIRKWLDKAVTINGIDFTDVHEFHELFAPYSVSISRIRTKPEDRSLQQMAYLIVIDKAQF